MGVPREFERERALAAFREYVRAYDPDNPRIALKISHTLRVAELCERIAGSLHLSLEDVDLAWLLGLLHDIGRFEQVWRYDSFSDAAVDHASLGAEVLFGVEQASEGLEQEAQGDSAFSGPIVTRPPILLRRFAPDEVNDSLIKMAVQTHNAYRLPVGLDNRTRMFCNILRDADKIDILKVNCTSSIEDIYRVTEREMVDSELSPLCVDVFYEHRCIPRDVRRFPADIMLGHICFAWELVFEESVAIVRDQGHLREMLQRSWSNPSTQREFSAMAAHMEEELKLA